MRTAFATLIPTPSGPHGLEGVVRFWQSTDSDVGGVVVYVHMRGVPKGLHGFHAHQSVCSQKMGHLSLPGQIHGGLNETNSHLGDFGNLESVGPQGTVRETLLLQRVSLIPGHPQSLIGNSLVLHSGRDDLGEFRATSAGSATSGNSGFRIACGNIVQGNGYLDLY